MRWVRALLKNASLAGAPKYIEHFSKFSPSPLSMKQFLDFGMERTGAGGPRDRGSWGAEEGVLARRKELTPRRGEALSGAGASLGRVQGGRG